MEKLKTCPFCGCAPSMHLGKRTGCQLHGDPSQPVVIKCNYEKCPAKPMITAGDVYAGCDTVTPENKLKAEQEAAEIWNRRRQAEKGDL